MIERLAVDTPIHPGLEHDFRAVPAGGLPIYRRDGALHSLYYTPGLLCAVPRGEANRFQEQLVRLRPTGEGSDPALTSREAGRGVTSATAAAMRCRAAAVLERWERLWSEPFHPECLTLYLNDECSLGCRYCYANATPSRGLRLEPDDVAVAADWVAAACRASGRPLVVGLHGGGEPLADRGHAAQVLDLAAAAARAHDVPLFTYVATSGILDESSALWLARHADRVGLSCDGPPDIQDRQRPFHDGRPTSATVERTARILREEGTAVQVRATITPATVRRQAEIIDYIGRVLRPQTVHLEPVYRGGRAVSGFGPPDAGEFVAGFLQARSAGLADGRPVLFSGARIDEIHGPYCHVFRHVANLVPGGLRTACFKAAGAGELGDRGLVLGRRDCLSGQFAVDQARLHELRSRLAADPPACAGCLNRYHCTRSCPDDCRLRPAGEEVVPGFRCRVQKLLALAFLSERAAVLPAQAIDHAILL